MKISLKWLKDYVDIDVTPEELAKQMTMLGLEIESIEQVGGDIDHIVVGQILSIEPHPDADKLVVCRTNAGREQPEQIVCGAKNMKVGDKVPTALLGATLPGGFKIERRKMRGIESCGMMCSARELGISEDHGGLMILDPDMTIGQDIKDALGIGDVVFEIEVIPNRGDWASMIGVARELAALYGKTCRIPALDLKESGEAASAVASVTIEANELCPRYIGRVLKNAKVEPSPQWLAERLIAAGQRPINNIVDITNYVLLETGHPLHAFDCEKLAGHQVVVRRASAGETINTLDGTLRSLQPEMLVIADAQRPQAVAGVMGGAESEVGEGTATILLESAVFHPISVRRTSRALGLITEASQHFQRGADPEMARYAIDRAAQLMQEIAGAEVLSGALDAYPTPAPVREVRLRYARCNQILGAEIAPDIQRQHLASLGFQAQGGDDTSVLFRIPSWRNDVTLEEDLVEEVARLFNYENIPTVLPHIQPSETVLAPQETRIRALRRFLAGEGLTELYNWTFSSPEAVQKAGLQDTCGDMVTLENPLSEKQATMRSSLIPGILANAAHNVRHGRSSMAVFEVGPVYLPEEGLPTQRQRLAILLAGSLEPKHWGRPQTPVGIFDLKGILETVFDFLGANVRFEAGTFGPMRPGQTAQLLASTTPVGWCGQVRANLLRGYDIESEIFLAEVELDLLLGREKAGRTFSAIPGFPPVLRDLAILVDRNVPAGEILKAAQQAGGPLLREADIFDIYIGKQVDANKKSIALSFVFQSETQTLTDSIIQKQTENIQKRLQKDFGATLR